MDGSSSSHLHLYLSQRSPENINEYTTDCKINMLHFFVGLVSPNFGSANSVFNLGKLSKDLSSPLIFESLPSSASSGITLLLLSLGFLDRNCALWLDPIPLLVREDPDRPLVLLSSLSRKRQIIAQSSVLELGYLNLQAWFAKSTTKRAAKERSEHEATTSTTSWFVKTSHTCRQTRTIYSM